MALRLARTNAEAHIYMELSPCEVCGATEFAPDHGVITVDGDLASQYAGPCPGCETPREFVFRIPEDVPHRTQSPAGPAAANRHQGGSSGTSSATGSISQLAGASAGTSADHSATYNTRRLPAVAVVSREPKNRIRSPPSSPVVRIGSTAGSFASAG